MQQLLSRLTVTTLLVLAGCSQAHVQTEQSYLGPQMPRPDRVVVAWFSVSPEQVRLDQGVSARLIRTVDDQPLDTQQMAAAQATQAALAEHLVDRLRQYGLPAELAMTTPAGPGTSLLVQGQIVGIDQGNRTRRVLIGLGAGKSTVTADAQLYYASGVAPPRFVSAFEGEADSGRAPGAAETMGAGAAAERVGTSAVLTGATHAGAETRRTTDTAEAGKLAAGLAKQIGQFAVAQGWIAQTALK
jgi:Domain of unknown function (DUF4410)